ncbi:c-type cytochrome [Oricola cellulosilytica]|uniref:Cytochrome c n=1 Tax=Oricola cellulosilytica TaxID=1429082 RepID=A0A4R0P9W8_9HYPH|nr:cytochrome c [Oricola cellulosilytica]TCD13725.1 cytochrome c [Oricola cellulosilytica]
MAKAKKHDIWSNLPKYFVIGVFAAGVVGIVVNAFIPGEDRSATTTGATAATLAEVKVPKLTETAQAGEYLFNSNCATCHGVNAAGTESAPPLVNDIYNPGHHSDESFYSAVANGVPAHHWPFGNMPRQPQVSEQQVAKIIAYVRELQAENGIGYREHRM